MIIDTERLFLRVMNQADYDDLYKSTGRFQKLAIPQTYIQFPIL